MMTAAPDKRTRKRASDRVSEMLDIVEARLNAERTATVSMKDIGDAAGASRALVYAYFPDQFRLLDAVLARHVEALSAAGLSRAAAEGSLTDRARAAAAIYLRHVVQSGFALEIVLREAAIARQLNGEATAFRGRIYRRLANQARRELRMPAHEALALIQLLVVIPEEAGKLVISGSLTLDEAQALCERLLHSSIESLRPSPAPSGRPSV
jgi:AcrR family transcriptional regulator